MSNLQTHSFKKSSYLALGFAFFIQAMTSLVSGTLFLGPLTDKTQVLHLMIDTSKSMYLAISASLTDIVTALVIICLGLLLYQATCEINKVLALLALIFYGVEAGLLIVSQCFSIAFINVSLEYALQEDSHLENLALLLLMLKSTTYSIHILPFGFGALIFYALLYRTPILPGWLSLWGLISVIPVLLGTIVGLYGIDVPFVFMLPYAPFEFFVGIYMVVCTLRHLRAS